MRAAWTFGPVLLTFVAAFPRRLPHAGYVQAITWIVTAAALAAPLYHAAELVYRGTALRSVGPGTPLLFGVSVVSIAAAGITVVTNYRRITDVSERRRLTAVVAGIATGILSGFPIVATFWLAKRANQTESIFASPAPVFAAVMLLAAPLSISYAVLRHRLFDVSFIIRQGLQYALARRLILSIVPALGAILIIDLLVNRNETINTVISRHGAWYLIVLSAAFIVHLGRRRWLDAIDRRFFRERQAGYAVLRDVAEQVRRAGSLDRVAPRVVAKIESAMHPEFAAMLARDRGDQVFRTLAAVPAASALQDLPADSKLVALMRALEQPLDTSEDGDRSLLQQLPAAELAFVRRARIDALIPVVTPDGRLQALIALGRKRSEEPYAREDYDVLVAIAENLALLVDRAAPLAERPSLEECPDCGFCFDGGTRVCTHDGRSLTARGLPRMLAGRYRLERRLAEGGMGTVYEALDTALDRPVAAKVVREDRAPNRGAAERFVDEARLAARFGHPNVVTVHDFGITDGKQPFLVMERLVGRTLRHELESSGRLPAVDVLWILDGVCSAVDAAHRLRLVHRDLKPENIFLVDAEPRPIPKVLDFGIAKPLPTLSGTTIPGQTRPGELVGTPEYMSPEQLRGELPTPAWDLWSLGVTALEMLEGSVAATASDPAGLRPSLARGGLTLWDPAAHMRQTHPRSAEFFSRALSIDAGRRPSDGQAFFEQLRAALHADGAVRDRSGHSSHEYVRRVRG